MRVAERLVSGRTFLQTFDSKHQVLSGFAEFVDSDGHVLTACSLSLVVQRDVVTISGAGNIYVWSGIQLLHLLTFPVPEHI